MLNKISQRKESNSKLLTILAKRAGNAHVGLKNEIWPGQRRPSFASTIKIRNASQPSQSQQLSDRNHEQPIFTNSRLENTRRNTKSLCSINTLTLRVKNDIKAMSSNTAKRSCNSKPSSKAIKIINTESDSRPQTSDLQGYVIDYMAFNYIGKVIDTPELWSKYVHKKLGGI